MGNFILKIQIDLSAHLVSRKGHGEDNSLINLGSWETGLKRKLMNLRYLFHASQHISNWLRKIELIGIGEVIER